MIGYRVMYYKYGFLDKVKDFITIEQAISEANSDICSYDTITIYNSYTNEIIKVLKNETW